MTRWGGGGGRGGSMLGRRWKWELSGNIGGGEIEEEEIKW